MAALAAAKKQGQRLGDPAMLLKLGSSLL